MTRVAGSRSVRLLLAILVLSALSGVSTAAPVGRLVIGVPSIPPTMDPHQFTAPIPTIAQHNVFDALAELDVAGNIKPSLASSWRQIDATTWEFKLRPGVQFHDGQPLTAEDVKYSYVRGADTKNSLTVGVSPRITSLESVDVIDNLTLRFRLNSPDAGWERKTSVIKILPSRYYASAGERQAALKPVGTGAFAVTRYVSGEVIILEPATRSWRGSTNLPQIELRAIPETTVRTGALRAGDIQMAVNITPEQIDPIRQAGFAVSTGELARVETVGMNTWTGRDEYKPFWDRRVRQALNYAVDKEVIVRNLLKNITTATGQYVTQGTLGYNPGVKPYPYNPSKAKELLSAAGYSTGFKVRMETSQGACIGDREVAEAVAGYLRNVGVEVEFRVLEFAAFGDLFHSLGRRAPLFYECWTASPQMDAEAVLVNLSAEHRSKRYSNALFAKLLNDSRVEMNPARRLQLLQRLASIAFDDPPAIFLFAEPQIIAHVRQLEGVALRRDGVLWMKDMRLSGR